MEFSARGPNHVHRARGRAAKLEAAPLDRLQAPGSHDKLSRKTAPPFSCDQRSDQPVPIAIRLWPTGA